MIHAAEEHIPA